MAAAIFPGLTWSEAFLLAAVLTPTDPVVTSTVVTAQRVPSIVRHTLNLESGLNDGLALPFVLFFLSWRSRAETPAARPRSSLGEAAFGAFVGRGARAASAVAFTNTCPAAGSPLATRGSTRSASASRPSGWQT